MPKQLSNKEIGQKISSGKNFWVSSNKERKLALAAARFAGKKISSRANGNGYTIFFL